MKKWRIAGINFDHMHMGDNLRMAFEHPNVEIVGICDEEPQRTEAAKKNFNISPDRIFTDYSACIDKTKPDIVILCPATAHHADWTERVATYDVNIIMEKPFAASLREANRMIAAMRTTSSTSSESAMTTAPMREESSRANRTSAVGSSSTTSS